ncbi:MAG: hypothetical protein ABIP79_16035 [Chitinophagaceae bacterium]
MNVQINQLVKSLLEKDSLEHCSLQEVKEYAERHPYFGAAQLLLTKKLQVENISSYNEQLQKTILFFHNPLWVKKILNDTGDATIIEKKKEEPGETTEEKIIHIPPIEIKEEEVITIADSSSEPDDTEQTANSANEELVELPAFKFEPVSSSKSDLLFEPFHTVDYFASQGINYKEEEKPTDKFGLQLRSFTDWLKTMKRLPTGETSSSEAPLADKKVEQMAEHSIKEREIVTITMAEVWEKQGNKAKAIDIYNKLSLLEPSKSPYFAAKIEDLKKTN